LFLSSICTVECCRFPCGEMMTIYTQVLQEIAIVLKVCYTYPQKYSIYF